MSEQRSNPRGRRQFSAFIRVPCFSSEEKKIPRNRRGSGGKKHRHRAVRGEQLYRVVSRRCTAAVRRSVTRTSVTERSARSGIPAQRTELVRREVVPVGRVVPHAANGLGRLEDQAIAPPGSRDVGRRDFVDAPVRSQRVDEAKARVRHPAFDSFLVDRSQPANRSVVGDSGRSKVKPRASPVSRVASDSKHLTRLPANTT